MTRSGGWTGRARRLPSTLPFTLTLWTIVMLVGVVSGAAGGRLPDDWLQQVGFAPIHLPRGEWWRLLAGVVVTHGGATYYATLAMLAWSVGLAESQLGTGRAILTFLVAHVATLLCQSLLIALPLHSAGQRWGTLLALELDVGPSAGYYGCLGRVLTAGGRRRGRVWAALVMAWLLARAALGAQTTADVAHVVAFAIGGVWGGVRAEE